MSAVQVSKQDIESLARKISTLEAGLTPEERALLLGMCAVVAEAVNRSAAGAGSRAAISVANGADGTVVVSVEDDAESIHDEFVDAFTPDSVRVTLAPKGFKSSIGRTFDKIQAVEAADEGRPQEPSN